MQVQNVSNNVRLYVTLRFVSAAASGTIWAVVRWRVNELDTQGVANTK